MSGMWTTDLATYEDGQRVDRNDQRAFEWWYFDAILDDGSTCVVTFLTKPPFTPGPVRPLLQLNISTPDGKVYEAEPFFTDYTAATDHCKVNMGGNLVEGDPQSNNYHLSVQGTTKSGDRLAADLYLQGVVPGWRMGPYLPPDQAVREWLGEQVVIPSGLVVRGELTYENKTHSVTGTCYHDHQWGGSPSPAQAEQVPAVTSWYWGRARVGDPQVGYYHVVFAQVMGKDGSGPIVPIAVLFMLARGTRMTFDDTVASLTVAPLDRDPVQGIKVEWKTNQGTLQLRLRSPHQIASFNQGKYVRFLSQASLTFGTFSSEGEAIWEINSF